jgi:hypothetical protein
LTVFLSDKDEEVRPVRLAHNVDLMPAADGKGLEFYYNYLIYEFENGGEQITAKHYLDEPTVINVQSGFALPLSDFARKVLSYLGLRYNVIQVPSDKGYVPLPAEVAQEVVAVIQQLTTGTG